MSSFYLTFKLEITEWSTLFSRESIWYARAVRGFYKFYKSRDCEVILVNPVCETRSKINNILNCLEDKTGKYLHLLI